MEIARREKWLIGAALGVGALIYLTTPRSSSTVEVATTHGASPRAAGQSVARSAPPGPLADFAHRVVGDSAAGALFAAHSWYTPPPPPPPAPQPVAIVRAPPVPTAPPLPYTYMGSWLRDGGQPVFFLTRNDRIYDVKVGDTLDGLYRFEGLSGNALVFTYVPLKIRQTLSVDGAK
jgi:hypothetical protein